MPLSPFPRRVAVLGASGSIGRKALAVAARYPDRLQVTAVATGHTVEALVEAAASHPVARVALHDPAGREDLAARLPDGVEIAVGSDAVAALAAREDVDLVVNGVVGRAGLEASLAAVRAGKMLALANKESLVLAGELIMAEAARTGAVVLPVDSEHSALFQTLEGRRPEDLRRLIITASGGPFRGRKSDTLAAVTPEEALRHPIWPMGPRITVDSATLFNKGLEVIEAYRLFPVPLDRIDVWVHPQSVVHGLAEMADGSLIAQLSAPDMMLPVQYAMTYPERWDCDAPPSELPDWKNLTFERPDHETFPAIRLAVRAAERGGTAPAVLNAADEVAVEAFLTRRLPFTGIIEVVAECLDRVPVRPADSLEAVVEADAAGREVARDVLAARAR